MTVGDVGVHRPIGSASVEAFRSLGFTGAFLAVTNVAISFGSYYHVNIVKQATNVH
jgi:hypothetical protein